MQLRAIDGVYEEPSSERRSFMKIFGVSSMSFYGEAAIYDLPLRTSAYSPYC